MNRTIRFLPVLLFLALFAGAQENPYLLGEFKVSRVMDGDTIGVEGLSQSIRFLCIDTEECFQGADAERRTMEVALDYERYLQEQIQKDPLGKFNSPLGWQAKRFAEQWFPIGSTVRIEYDSPSRKTDYYGRALGYVFAKRDGEWVNYNVECVRAGFSPYYEKYGHSERFEAEFLAAEREARLFQRGIWSPRALGYPNYEERIIWWMRRSWALKYFQSEYASRNNAIYVIDEADWDKLARLVGQEVILFGSVNDKVSSSGSVILEMHHKQNVRLGVIVPDPAQMQSTLAEVERYQDDFVFFQGILNQGFDRGGRTFVYTLELKSPEQFFVHLPHHETLTSGRASAVEEVLPLGEGEISWRDAPARMGEDVVVVGRIIRTNSTARITFLNFHEDFRNTLTVVIHQENYNRFPQAPVNLFKDKLIRVRGKVSEYENKPQIVVNSPEQIDIIQTR